MQELQIFLGRPRRSDRGGFVKREWSLGERLMAATSYRRCARFSTATIRTPYILYMQFRILLDLSFLESLFPYNMVGYQVHTEQSDGTTS